MAEGSTSLEPELVNWVIVVSIDLSPDLGGTYDSEKASEGEWWLDRAEASEPFGIPTDGGVFFRIVGKSELIFTVWDYRVFPVTDFNQRHRWSLRVDGEHGL